jgi:TRAP-type C4-dicarboxylate transport system permease small subunit
MKYLEKLSDFLAKLAIVIAGALCAAILCLVLYGVFLRITGNAFSMSEELSRWGMIAMTFIGASAALKNKQHIGVNMLVQRVSLAIGKPMVFIAYLVAFALLGISFWFSLEAAIATSDMMGDIIPIPMMYVKLSLPLGMFMMMVHLLVGFLQLFKAKDINKVLIGS